MNHFAAERGPRVAVQAAMARLSDWPGWRPRLPYRAVGDWIAAQPDAELIERRVLAPLSLFTLLSVRKAR